MERQKHNIIYVGTTVKCSACKCIEVILNNIKKDIDIFDIVIKDFNDLPDWIKINVPLDGFPIVVLVKDNVIKYHFSGTKPINEIKELIKELFI